MVDSGAGHAAASNATVEYDILLSPTYQVPVLYFRLADVAAGYPTGLDFVYRYLVPADAQSQLQQTSVMGGVSLQVRSHACNGCQTGG